MTSFLLHHHHGWPDRNEFRSKILSFSPFVCEIGKEVTNWYHYFSPTETHCYKDIMVTVCTVPIPTITTSIPTTTTTESAVLFHGDAERQEKMSLKFGSFCEAFVDTQHQSMDETTTKSPHWIQTLGLSLYLSQCTLYDASTAAATTVATAEEEEFPREFFHGFQKEMLASSTFPLSFLDRDQDTYDEMFCVDQVNLWMNIGPTISSLHYDNYNNILVVMNGTKLIHLISPEGTSKLKPFPATSMSANHAHISHVADLLDTGQLSATEVMTITLHAGEALFIPEGYWHEVHSDACTVALNFWFHGFIANLLLKNTAMLPYILRTCVHGMSSITTAKIHSSHDASCDMSNMDTWDVDAFATFMKQLHESIVVTSLDQENGGHKRGRKENNHGNDLHDMSLLETQFVHTSKFNIIRLWPPFAQMHPQLFGDILLSLSPQGAHCILSTWEDESSNHDSTLTLDTSFFTTLFQPCGERTQPIRQYLIHQSDTYVKQITIKQMHDILGTT